eukprot:6494052-Karenia_brevis.AAC.1
MHLTLLILQPAMHHQSSLMHRSSFHVMLLVRPLMISFSAAISAMQPPSSHHQYSLMLEVKQSFQFSRAGQI